ncbi:lysylphosphatidylglycerol synthase transmembrane domain-containing protein [Butyrivibrio sp. YAB3001]|uniref:lysylphosphatidylglycerol synthase transmembrane domain-containing protein n=1 Tax=Butyrivibrio sp. YAB3001 TaxID=1520812 RepID=UPI0008F6465D|nr:lysylphosphatidylglycerol synthase transmembrane domain-containing protein [Butyrivibrio sp. YAB3001]SFC99487.1 hypothetical protein SAMN02910398_03722 [Butyrivibrio sp. YAB3001]
MQYKRKIHKNIIWTIVSLILAVSTIRLVLKEGNNISLRELTTVISSSNKIFLILGAISSLMYVWFEGVAICSILKSTEYRQSKVKGLLYSTSDIYFSAITPSASGGQPASAYFMIKDGIPAGIATATLILNIMMYTISILVLGIVSVIISPNAFWGFSGFARFLIYLGFTILSVLAFFFYALLKKEKLIFNPLKKMIFFLYNKKIINEKDKKLSKLEKIRNDYTVCSSLISGKKRVLVSSFIWNFIQRTSQMIVPMLIYASLGGNKVAMATVFSKQCLTTIGYNFIPIPGGMGIADYLMIDSFIEVMGEQMAYNVELISRGMTFYICVFISGITILVGYMVRRNRKK